MPRPSASQPAARDRILACASDLFYRKGINHVGINEIIGASGIARMTLYHHFASKNDVIVAVLERRMAERRQAMQAVMEAAHSPRDKVMAAFGYLRDLVGADAFRGCVFINAAVELADPSHPGAVLSAQHKQRMADGFARIADDAGWPDAAGFGLQCQLLWDGAVAAAQLNYTAAAVDAACQAVGVLIAARESAARPGPDRTAKGAS
ncbi:TetR/AcrR family transcriptional regulator [Castellaniella sp.]|uniref:TetR/AcrR family transcriptional regulator n=1 Tax=Castellaniella sp. TaxID=1955812 RepID=UPI002AFE1A0F|nr:TetR/AcrR family transcriptional regulator [Castellaniella sp.]